MTAAQLMLPANRAFDSNGFPEAGATVKLYQSGTTTPANFYADAALTIVLGSTLTANAAGRIVTPAYQDRLTPFRLKVFDAAGDELDDIDPFYFGSTYTTVASTASTNVATRTAMAAIVGVAGAVVNLTETGREGQFIFSSANLSAKVSADTAQGVYVAPAIDPTGASGAWVRKYYGEIFLEWFGGGPSVADNATAFTVATTVVPYCMVRLNPATYLFSTLSIPGGVRVQGDVRFGSTITITGNGTGAPTAGVNGGVQLFGSFAGLSDVTLTYTNPLLQCLLNVGGIAAAPKGRIVVERVDLQPDPSLTASQINCLGIGVGALVSTTFRDVWIGSAPNFKQDMKLFSISNGVALRNVTFRPHADDIANGVHHLAYPQLDLNNCSTWGLVLDNCTFENGPNGISVTGQGVFTVRESYLGDGYTINLWQPNTAYAQGTFILPASIQTTGSIDVGVSTTTLNVAAATNLYIGQRLVIPGAGTAGANLSTNITAIAGTAITIAPAAATTVTGVNVYAQTYAGHIYRCIVAGTSGSTPPAFPTTFQSTVVDNTATLMEYGSGGWVDCSTPAGITGKNIVNVRGNYIGNGIGVVGRRTSGTFGINIEDNAFVSNALCGSFNSAMHTRISGNELNGYAYGGFEYFATAGGSLNNIATVNHFLNNTYAATFIISTGTTSMGGYYIGQTGGAPTGIAKSKWTAVNLG